MDSKVAAQSGQEPPSGIEGKGTIDSPYDQGNAPEQAAGPGIEPPSGQQGKGTIDSPYDQGNEPENPPKDTLSTPSSKPTQPSPADPLASSSTTHQGSGIPLSEPTAEQEKVIHESRGRDETAQRTTSTLSPSSAQTQRGGFDASKAGAGEAANKLRLERSMSPGQLADGSHVQTSGDKGQSYDPSKKMDKLKHRFGIGRHH